MHTDPPPPVEQARAQAGWTTRYLGALKASGRACGEPQLGVYDRVDPSAAVAWHFVPLC